MSSMTRASEVRELIDYTRWANEQMLDATAALSTNDFVRDLGNSFPSVRDTLVHVMSAEWVWLSRLLGQSPTEMPVAWKSYDHAQVRAGWADVARGHAGFVQRLDDADLEGVLDYRLLSGQPGSSTIGQILRHVDNHSTYHRGQVATMLRQLGAKAPTTDLIHYYRTRPTRQKEPLPPA